jgi:hypothetical protein
MEDVNKGKWIDRIRAIMAKTADAGCTAEEAEAASLKAAALMEKYHIEASEVMGQPGDKPVEMATTIVKPKYNVWKPWTVRLASVLSAMAGVFVVRHKEAAELHIYGTKEAAEAAAELWELLQNAIVTSGNTAWKSGTWREAIFNPDVKRDTWLYAYRLGFIEGLWDKLREQRTAHSRGLIVIDNARAVAQNYSASIGVRTKSGRATKSNAGANVNSGAFNRGRVDGKGHQRNQMLP